MKNITLYMIPGTGTDKRMFMPQLEHIPAIAVPAWLSPLDENESVESYARRLAATIDISVPFMLGGVSFGGMIAQQMATFLKPVSVILIATCSDSHSLSGWARLSGKLMRHFPDFFIRLQQKFLGFLINQSSLLHKAVYAQMAKEISPTLLRWQSGAATEWQLKEILTMPVHHIHGTKDPLIPISKVHCESAIQDGGHLINITHANAVNQFIEQILRAI